MSRPLSSSRARYKRFLEQRRAAFARDGVSRSAEERFPDRAQRRRYVRRGLAALVPYKSELALLIAISLIGIAIDTIRPSEPFHQSRM